MFNVYLKPAYTPNTERFFDKVKNKTTSSLIAIDAPREGIYDNATTQVV